MRDEYRRITSQTLKGEKLDGYSIYMIFGQDPNKRASSMRVYGGHAISKKQALELAYRLLYEEGGGVEAVAVIDWASQDETFVRRTGRPQDDGPEAP